MFSPLYTKNENLYSIGGNFVREFTVRFGSFRDIQEFVELAGTVNFTILVGDTGYQVCGTSLMGMFSLDHSRPLQVMMDCGQEEFESFRRKAERFLVHN